MTQYQNAMKLITDVSKGIADLNDLLKSPASESLTEDEQKSLRLALIKLVVVIKEFGK